MTCADRQPGGGRREAWLVDVETSDGQRLELFLRYDRSDPAESGDPFTLHDEAKFFLALQDTPVPVPRICAVHPVEQAILASRVPGQTWFSQLQDEQQRLSVATDFMGILAGLHALDPHRLDLPGQDPDEDLRDLVRVEIKRWETLYRHANVPNDPLIEFGLNWVKKNVPDVAGPVVIVQGDTGPGNFLYADGRVSAVLDWELAHLGDPHDDLAWLTVRAVQEPFTYMPDRLQDYAAASGRTLDHDRIRYYQVLAELRIAILNHHAADNVNPLSEVGNSLIYGVLHRRLLVEALVNAFDLPPAEAAEVESTESDEQWLYDAALAQVAQIIVPRSSDPFVIQRSKGLARILKYLRDVHRFGNSVEEYDVADLESLLGQRVDSTKHGQARLIDELSSGSVEVIEVIRFFQRKVARETEVCRAAMGVLADRHFDPLV